MLGNRTDRENPDLPAQQPSWKSPIADSGHRQVQRISTLMKLTEFTNRGDILALANNFRRTHRLSAQGHEGHALELGCLRTPELATNHAATYSSRTNGREREPRRRRRNPPENAQAKGPFVDRLWRAVSRADTHRWGNMGRQTRMAISQVPRTEG